MANESFNFPVGQFGYIPGVVPAKMHYSQTQPENPVEGLWWVREIDGAEPELAFYSGSVWVYFGAGAQAATAVNVIRSAATSLTLDKTLTKNHYLMTSDTPVTVTLAADTFVAQSPCVMFLTQYGLGTVTVVGASGVSVRVPDGYAPSPAGQFSTIGLELIGDNEWLLVGSLA